ncbi:MAG: Holliday junction resolvase RuvX [Opitutia bacterium]|jgi:putative Holliday junction resolvase
MPVYLGIDYGERRIGLSHGDDLGFAFALPAALEPEPEARLARIAQEIERRRVTDLVVGYPLRLDGSRSRTTDAADRFIATLEQRFRLPIHRVDESLSSAAAEDALARRKPRSPQERRSQQRDGQVDSRAAQVILQDFLNSRGGAALPDPDAQG